MSTVVFKFHTKISGRGRIRLKAGDKKKAPVGSTPRISRLMALAIKFDQLVNSGQIRDYSELARLGHVTRARMSQIMSLLNLAPDIQEKILSLPKTVTGLDCVSSREVIHLAKEVDFDEQRRLWKRIGDFRTR